ncbi:hypothetical protein MYX07_06695 [Patescibacteria group bacterium AH-259-L07]|nr:hypothetical protein [Patescibacteria group bacterium AH-259-L07]
MTRKKFYKMVSWVGLIVIPALLFVGVYYKEWFFWPILIGLFWVFNLIIAFHHADILYDDEKKWGIKRVFLHSFKLFGGMILEIILMLCFLAVIIPHLALRIAGRKGTLTRDNKGKF